MGVQTIDAQDGGVSYRPRVADSELAQLLRATGAVVVEGPRACGKTQTALRAAASAVRLDVDDAARAAGLLSPGLLLTGPLPRLIDEWQLVPGVWNHVRRAVDDAGGRPGQFVLTGSAAPADDATRHSGAGRFSRLRMRTMTLAEAGRSTAAVSLEALLDGQAPVAGDPGLDVRDIAGLVAVGGWPALLGRPVDAALAAVRGYLDETRRADLARADGIARDPDNVGRVLRSLARHVGTQASSRSIAADIGGAEGPIDHHTVLSYLAALSRVFVVEDLPAWSPALRSRTPLRAAPTRHFVDPSLAVAALGADPDRLLRDVETLGLLFESLVVRDLRVFAQALDATVSHYRDAAGLEADAIVERRNGAWAAFEVKLGPSSVDDGARSLLRLAERVDADRHGRAAALVVVTGWGYAYRRSDGVCVVPVGALSR
jgi:predicted AAA+ superfamily ATPase